MKKLLCFSIITLNLLLTVQLSVCLSFDNVKFAIISDPHISIPQQKGVSDGYRLGLQTVMLTESAVSQINKIEGLNFVLVAGDLTQDSEPWNLDELRRILDGLKVPYYVVLGNHDASLVPHAQKDQPITLSKYSAAAAFIGRSGGMTPGMTYYAHEVAKDLLLVGLDTSRPQVYVPEAGLNDFGGRIDKGQMKWLASTLKNHQNKTVIILTHHSFVPWHEADNTKYNSWRWFWIDNAEEVRALLKKYNVKLVFSGHRHISTRHQKVDGIYHFVTPSISTYPMRYTVYEMTPNSIAWDVKDVPAPQEVWDMAKKNFLSNKWWRGPDHSETPQGDEAYLRFYGSNETRKGAINFK